MSLLDARDVSMRFGGVGITVNKIFLDHNLSGQIRMLVIDTAVHDRHLDVASCCYPVDLGYMPILCAGLYLV